MASAHDVVVAPATAATEDLPPVAKLEMSFGRVWLHVAGRAIDGSGKGQPAQVYTGGTISGLVRVEVEGFQYTKLNSLSVAFEGRLFTAISGNGTRHQEDVQLCNIKQYLLGDASSKDIKLVAGTHSYPFTISLPPPGSLPNSLKDSHRYGNISYQLVVRPDVAWRSNMEQMVEVPLVDAVPPPASAHAPARAEGQLVVSSAWCCGGDQGMAALELSAPEGCLAVLPTPGASASAFPAAVSVHNRSKRSVAGLRVHVRQIVTYRAGPATRTVFNLSPAAELPGEVAADARVGPVVLHVPLPAGRFSASLQTTAISVENFLELRAGESSALDSSSVLAAVPVTLWPAVIGLAGPAAAPAAAGGAGHA